MALRRAARASLVLSNIFHNCFEEHCIENLLCVMSLLKQWFVCGLLGIENIQLIIFCS